MPETVQPRKPVENWEQVRDDWVAEVNRLVAEVEAWAGRHGWGTLRDDKAIAEDRIGTYRVPVLLIHTPKGRLLLSPEARYVVGADGLIDLNVYPSFDVLVSIVKAADGWRFKSAENGLGEPVSEESFARAVRELQNS